MKLVLHSLFVCVQGSQTCMVYKYRGKFVCYSGLCYHRSGNFKYIVHTTYYNTRNVFDKKSGADLGIRICIIHLA